ncbi:MAG: GNAT family N-acetyltransferase, partial [Theionarchaea archaeon]|nr:GNAT family N-acetyltransferase [Theionarchaea archaeon]
MVMEIRCYSSGDSREMELIAPRAFMGLGLARYAIDHELDRDRVADYYRKEAAGYAQKVEAGAEDMAIFIAEDAGEVVGYIVMEVEEPRTRQFGIPWGRIVSLSVDPDRQHRGAGKSLVSRGLEWLSERGVEYAEVLTDQNNVAAQRAYEASGFRAVY